jgi:hypothetical protein
MSIEGEWKPSLPDDRQSVRPLLGLLEQQDDIAWSHRDAATREELHYLLERWSTERPYRDHRFLYLSFHGSAGTIRLSNGDVQLGRLATRLKGRCKGKIIHFGACEVFDTSPRRLSQFRETTGAELVSGYTQSVDWIESAALDMLLMAYIARRPGRLDLALRLLNKRAGPLIEHLGFVSDPPLPETRGQHRGA